MSEDIIVEQRHFRNDLHVADINSVITISRFTFIQQLWKLRRRTFEIDSKNEFKLRYYLIQDVKNRSDSSFWGVIYSTETQHREILFDIAFDWGFMQTRDLQSPTQRQGVHGMTLRRVSHHRRYHPNELQMGNLLPFSRWGEYKYDNWSVLFGRSTMEIWQKSRTMEFDCRRLRNPPRDAHISLDQPASMLALHRSPLSLKVLVFHHDPSLVTRSNHAAYPTCSSCSLLPCRSSLSSLTLQYVQKNLAIRCIASDNLRGPIKEQQDIPWIGVSKIMS